MPPRRAWTRTITSLEANSESGHVVRRIRGWTTVSGMQIEMAVARPLHNKEVAMPVKITEEVRCCGNAAAGYAKACAALYRSISLVEATDRDDPVFEWVDESKPVGPSLFGRHERLPMYTIFRPKGLFMAGAFDDTLYIGSQINTGISRSVRAWYASYGGYASMIVGQSSAFFSGNT